MAIELTTPVWPCQESVLSNRPVAASQSLTEPSPLPLASVLPSRLKATELTPLVCPASVLSNCPLAASQSRTVLSPLPLAIVLLSGLNATEVTLPVCPVSVLGSWPLPASQSSMLYPLPLAPVLPSGL